MAGSLNRVMLIGRLTRDPELRYTPSGTPVCNLDVATNRYGQDQSGERREFTDYHDIVVWNQGNRKLAELCSQYLQKGRLVYVEGRLQTRSWEDAQSGQKRYRTEVNANDVQFLDSRQDGAGGAEARPAHSAAALRRRTALARPSRDRSAAWFASASQGGGGTPGAAPSRAAAVPAANVERYDATGVVARVPRSGVPSPSSPG